MVIGRGDGSFFAVPLEEVRVASVGKGVGPGAARLEVTDGEGRQYHAGDISGEATFTVGGALGTHTAVVRDSAGAVMGEARFEVDAASGVADGEGTFKELYDTLNETMRWMPAYGGEQDGVAKDRDSAYYSPDGTSPVLYKGREYRVFVRWILDHLHTAKGLMYTSPHAKELVDLLREAQRADGLIWSNAYTRGVGDYHYAAYRESGYSVRDPENDITFTRQPVENHCEYNYVECAYLSWKSGGDDAWMEGTLDSCMRALDYGMNDRARWSEKYGLLKRGYTIDTWDFQAVDEYLVRFPLGERMQIDPDSTKFGVFFGDNTGYARSCDELAEMLAYAGRAAEAEKYRERAAGIRERLDALSWNGRFYRHHVPEDEGVVRDFGVDEAEQLNMSNAYTLNRGCTAGQAEAIIRSYQRLREALPEGSPGEFYSIYPPFERGFTGKWQYMNAGVHGHAAGELARGAFRFGFEGYGADILVRLLGLAKRSGGKLKFAYKGAEEPEPEPRSFTALDLSRQANMGLRNAEEGGAVRWMPDRFGIDIADFPTGRREFAGVPYEVADPGRNGGRVAVAVSTGMGLPESAEVPVGAMAGSVYLLHSASGDGGSGVSCYLTFIYEDGSSKVRPILYGRHVTTQWWSRLDGKGAGVAWKAFGGNGIVQIDRGICWAEIENPEPGKAVAALRFGADPCGSAYAVLGVTLADRPSFERLPISSFGGPDNWAGGLAMAALMEGLAGVEDRLTMYRDAVVSPRWAAAGTDKVEITARYAASHGYVKYAYSHDREAKAISVTITGSGARARLRVLLPEGAAGVKDVSLPDGTPLGHEAEAVGGSLYAASDIVQSKPVTLVVRYY
ncbi:MAG: hypothetical protein FWE70_06260 [Oscillospiraceae bacterium]|nr:hypothetical protein [Oscillospiraceae bacterium]